MNFNGYTATHRNKWLLLQHKTLTLQELCLFDFLQHIMDFDPNHGEKFGMYYFYPEEIAPVFCRTTESVRDWHNSLLRKQFSATVKKERSLYKLLHPERYLTNSNKMGKAHEFAKVENSQPLEIILENTCFFPAKLEKILKTKEKNPTNATHLPQDGPTIAKGSYKVDSSIYRSSDQYKRIYKGGGYLGLVPEDMSWLDETVC